MPTPTVWPSAKQFVNAGVETTQGTAVATTATLLFEEFKPKDVPLMLEDKGLRGSMVEDLGLVQGPEKTEMDMSGPCFFDGIGYILKNILGDITESGAAAPFTHTFSTLNSGTGQPSSLTLIDWQGTPLTNLARTYAGVCFSELTLSGNAESSLIRMTAKAVGFPSAVSAAAPTSAPTAISPQAAWRTAMGLAGPATGGTQVKTIGEWEITITRQLKVIWTLQNAQTPYIIQRGKVTVKGKLKFTAPADESNNMLYLLNNTQPQAQILVDNGVVGANQLQLKLDLAKAAYETSDIDRGSEAVGYDVTFRAIANTTNAGASGGYSPISATLLNAVALATY